MSAYQHSFVIDPTELQYPLQKKKKKNQLLFVLLIDKYFTSERVACCCWEERKEGEEAVTLALVVVVVDEVVEGSIGGKRSFETADDVIADIRRCVRAGVCGSIIRNVHHHYHHHSTYINYTLKTNWLTRRRWHFREMFSRTISQQMHHIFVIVFRTKHSNQ